MSVFSNVRIAARLTVGFTGIFLLMVAMTVIAILEVNNIDQSLTAISDVNNVKQRHAIDFRGSVHDRSIALRDVVLLPDANELRAELAQIDRLAENYRRAAAALDEMFAARADTTPRERQILASIKETEARTLPLVRTVIERRQAGDAARANEVLVAQARPAFVEWLQRINQFIDHQETESQKIAATARTVAKNFQTLMIAICAAALAVGAALAWWCVRSVRPLRRLTGTTLRLAGGDLSIEVPPATGRDEVGELIGAIQVFKDNMIRAKRMEAEAEETERRAEAEKRQAMNELADRFDRNVGSIVGQVSAAATGLEATAQSLTAAMGETNAQASTVAATAVQATTNVETVARACDELAGSIRSIGDRVRQSLDISTRAVRQAEDTQGKAEGLVTAAQKIGEVVQLINNIAQQTNLLALNATIEAARAGEAGKGFAVVASEVKNLANQTAKATEDITTQIADVQNVTQSTVAAIREIGQVIGESSQIASSIASAVEQQNAATQEIARNVQETSAGTSNVSRAIAQVSTAAAEGGSAADRVLASAQDLSRSATVLRGEVDGFLRTVRTA